MNKKKILKAVEILNEELIAIENNPEEKITAIVTNKMEIPIPNSYLKKLNMKEFVGIIEYKKCIMISNKYNQKSKIDENGFLAVPMKIQNEIVLNSGDSVEIFLEGDYIAILKQ